MPQKNVYCVTCIYVQRKRLINWRVAVTDKMSSAVFKIIPIRDARSVASNVINNTCSGPVKHIKYYDRKKRVLENDRSW